MARTIVHLSDLHFGRIDLAILPALVSAVTEAAPDLVVISGDFTQRARTQEFEAARRFLGELPFPQLSVPGNHDVPLYNILRRWLSPLARYQRYISGDLAPVFTDEEILVLGINTARSLTFKDGRINRAQIEAAVTKLKLHGKNATRIVVTHHPFDVPAAEPGAAPSHGIVGRADLAMTGFLTSGVDIILSGHLHMSGVGDTATQYASIGRGALLIRAGTATSTRRRGQVNAFNILHISQPDVQIQTMVWRPDEKRFTGENTERFSRTDTGWLRLST